MPALPSPRTAYTRAVKPDPDESPKSLRDALALARDVLRSLRRAFGMIWSTDARLTLALAALSLEAGAETIDLGIVSDDLAALRDAVGRARAAEADLLVTLGGASVGDHDLVRPALEALGVSLDFWTLAMRPGKPMIYGRRGAQHYLGLPGNPVSALITARVFAVPLVGVLLGRPATTLSPLIASTTAPLEANGPRQHYMRARLEPREDGGLSVTPQPNQDSSLLVPLAGSNALLVRPIRATAVPAGTPVPVLRLDF